MSDIGLIVTVIIQIILIFTTEFYGPIATFTIANRYLFTVVSNNPIIQEDPPLHLPFSSLFKLLLNPDLLPNAEFVDPTLEQIVTPGSWKMFTFIGYGNPVTMNNLQFPDFAEALYGIKDLWNAYASLLAPNAKIRFHRTLSKGLIRWFVPLQHDGLELLYYGQTLSAHDNRQHQTTKELTNTIIFDGTTMHAIVNKGNSWSLMLVIDTIRPLEGFPLAFNRLSLGTIARHKIIEAGLQRAACRLDSV